MNWGGHLSLVKRELFVIYIKGLISSIHNFSFFMVVIVEESNINSTYHVILM